MEDVIFNGTDGRKPLGMAEVNLTFSNEDGSAPEEYAQYSEITVTRRLYRSGESEYLINKTPCRLRDITDLFLDTGIGVNGYSIVEQGRVEYLINSNPQDRRFLIEEAAGIEAPPRARYIRTIVAELERIHSHYLWVGIAAHEIGFDTLFMYSWRDREVVMDPAVMARLSSFRV
jgi:hypothetical protein